MPKRIEDEFTNEKLTANQKHYRRKVRDGKCVRGGCRAVLTDLERQQNSYLCEVHRAISAAYQKARYNALKTMS